MIKYIILYNILYRFFIIIKNIMFLLRKNNNKNKQQSIKNTKIINEMLKIQK